MGIKLLNEYFSNYQNIFLTITFIITLLGVIIKITKSIFKNKFFRKNLKYVAIDQTVEFDNNDRHITEKKQYAVKFKKLEYCNNCNGKLFDILIKGYSDLPQFLYKGRCDRCGSVHYWGRIEEPSFLSSFFKGSVYFIFTCISCIFLVSFFETFPEVERIVKLIALVVFIGLFAERGWIRFLIIPRNNITESSKLFQIEKKYLVYSILIFTLIKLEIWMFILLSLSIIFYILTEIKKCKEKFMLNNEIAYDILLRNAKRELDMKHFRSALYFLNLMNLNTLTTEKKLFLFKTKGILYYNIAELLKHKNKINSAIHRYKQSKTTFKKYKDIDQNDDQVNNLYLLLNDFGILDTA